MRAKPRVVAFITSYFPYVGGAEICLRQVAARLSDRYEFLIITSRANRRNPAVEGMDEGRVVRRGIGSRFDKWLLPAAAIGLGRRLAREAEAGTRQVMWGVDITQASLAAAIVRRFQPRVPLLLSIQYGEPDQRLAHGRLGLIGRSFSYMLSQADRVTAISTTLAETARTYGWDQPLSLIPNGVDLTVFHPDGRRRQASRPVVISVSRLVRKNGLDTLLRALAVDLHGQPAVECRLIGSGPELASLARLADGLGIVDRVHFLGDLQPQAVAQQLRSSDLFVRPSRSEGLGNAFAEAMACGLPVIGTPVGGAVDLIADDQTGLLAAVDDPHDLAAKIGRLLADRPLADRLAAAGQARVRQRHNLEAIAEQYAALFDELLAA